jgi:hypothetical protein
VKDAAHLRSTDEGEVMRKKVLQTVAMISFVVAIGMAMVGSAQAQSLADPIKVNIPFDFQVADTKFPAGEYYVRRLPHSSSDSVVMISSVDAGHVTVRLTSAVETFTPKDKGTLVFHRYGEQYFLYQVWPAGGETGRVLPRSRSEREAKDREFVGTLRNKGQVETVIVVSGQR